MSCSNHPSTDQVVGLLVQAYAAMTRPYLASERVSEAAANGKFAEFVALLGNRGAQDLNFHASSFEVFDNTSKSQICSVKTHSEGKEARIAARYCADFRSLIGTRAPQKFEKAAERLFEARDLLPVPDAIQQARSPDEVKAYLAGHAIMQVPEQHVEAVKEALRSSIRGYPVKYGLTRAEATNSSVVEALVSRVKPLR